jgi:hypothetical protein
MRWRPRVAHGRLAVVAAVVAAAAAAAAAKVVLLGRGDGAAEGRLPLLPPRSGRQVEADMPDSVKARLVRQQLAWLARARAARLAPRSRAAGCEPVVGEFSRYFGPPLPEVEARIIGRRVEVTFDFGRLPTSAGAGPSSSRRPSAVGGAATGPARSPTSSCAVLAAASSAGSRSSRAPRTSSR